MGSISPHHLYQLLYGAPQPPTPPHTNTPDYLLYQYPKSIDDKMKEISGLPQTLRDYITSHADFGEGDPQTTKDIYDEGVANPPGPRIDPPDPYDYWRHGSGKTWDVTGHDT